MKLIVALVRPEHRDAVLDSVNKLDAGVVSMGQVSDGGMSVVSGAYRGAPIRSQGLRLRLEVAADDSAAADVVKAIVRIVGVDAGAAPERAMCS